MGGLPPVFVEFLGNSAGVKRALADVKRETKIAADESEGAFGRTGRLGAAAMTGIGIAAGAAAIGAVHMAADFETQMTRVRTGAGETAANMKLVSDGVLAMAGQVCQSTEALTSGLYMVESAGYHGAAGLTVLENSAKGAKVGAAELGTVADAVTTAMNAYKMGADQSAQATNALIATEAAGKTNLEALAGSMSSILPTAAAAHVGLNEVLGAMATMTSQGTSANVAATYLRQTIGALSAPSGKAAQEMKSLGLDSVQVSQNLGKNGLASTLTELTDAIQKKMGPAGTVLIDHLQKAANNTTAYQKVLANLPPAQQTYIGALATMVGGTKSMQAALQLTGPHMADFRANTESIAEHVKAGGKQIEGWSDVQKTFNQRMAEAKGALQATAIQVGQYLLPAVSAAAKYFAEGTTWLAKHKQAAEALAITIGTVLVFALAAVTAELYAMAAAAAVNPVTWIILGVVALIAALVLLIMHWRQVWDWIKGIAADVSKAVAGAWHWLADETSSAWDSVVAWVMHAWQSLVSHFLSAWHSVVDPIVAGWRRLEADTKAAWDSVAAWVVHAWQSLVAFFVSAWHFVVDPIVAGWQWLASVTTAVWNAISGFFMKWWPLLLVIFLPFIAAIIAFWNHFHTAITSTARAVWSAIMGFLQGAWERILAMATTAWLLIRITIIDPVIWLWKQIEKIWNAITDAAQAVWTALVSFFGATWNFIKDMAQTAWDLIRTLIVDPIMWVWDRLVAIWDAVSGYLTAKWNELKLVAEVAWIVIKARIIEPVMQVWHQIVDIFDKVKSAIGDAFDHVLSIVGAFADKFVDVGKAIVMGIVHGVENAGSFLVDKMKGLAGDALNAAKSFLGINSPSRVFAEHVGHAIPEGIAMGVQARASLATGAARQLAQLALGAAAVTNATAYSPAGVLTSAGSAAPVIVHNHFNIAGTVVAEQELVQLVRRENLRYGARNLTTNPAFAL